MKPAALTLGLLPLPLFSLMAVGMAAAAPSPAGNTTVYRCGQTYQQVPCQDGQAIAVGDARDPAQRAAALQAAAAERRNAEQLTAERHAREKASQAAVHTKASTRVAAPVAAHVKPAHVKRDKRPNPLEANEKTLYSAREKKPVPDARMPAP